MDVSTVCLKSLARIYTHLSLVTLLGSYKQLLPGLTENYSRNTLLCDLSIPNVNHIYTTYLHIKPVL